jgi:hypothetical protein
MGDLVMNDPALPDYLMNACEQWNGISRALSVAVAVGNGKWDRDRDREIY